MPTLTEGDRVRITDREATAEDLKSGLFYNHFRGLTGTIQKVYGEEAAVEIDTGALLEPVANRHVDVQEAMKTQWLERLSEEAKNRLTAQERDFKLRYTVLVAVKDLTPHRGEAPTPAHRATEAELSAAEEAELAKRNGR